MDDGGFLVFPIHGKEVVPFWSSRSRLEKVATEHPKYATYQPEQLPLEEFLQKTLALFEEENIQVGVNWAGARLSGYDISPQDMKINIAHWLSGNVA